MKLTYVANAACFYEHAGYKILCDPWLTEGAFEGSWGHFPPLTSKPSDFFDVNLIYISHLHPDHYDEQTLKAFPKDIPILMLDAEPNFLMKKMIGLGFSNLHLMKDGAEKYFGPFKITMYAPFVGHLFHETIIGNLIDSGIVLECEKWKILNSNDNAPTTVAAKMLKLKHGAFDLVQLVDSCAGPYPACFKNLSDGSKRNERARILKRHLDLMIQCAHLLNAKYMQPFAGHYQLIGRLQKLNEYLGVYDPAEVAKIISEAGLKPLLLYEKDTYSFDIDQVAKYPTKEIDRDLWQAWAEVQPYTYDRLEFNFSNKEVTKLFVQAEDRLRKMQERFKSYPNWEITIKGGRYSHSFDLSNHKDTLNQQITFEMDERALLAVLTKRIHWNNLEVGCHIDITRKPNNYSPDIHLLMCFFHA